MPWLTCRCPKCGPEGRKWKRHEYSQHVEATPLGRKKPAVRLSANPITISTPKIATSTERRRIYLPNSIREIQDEIGQLATKVRQYCIIDSKPDLESEAEDILSELPLLGKRKRRTIPGSRSTTPGSGASTSRDSTPSEGQSAPNSRATSPGVRGSTSSRPPSRKSGSRTRRTTTVARNSSMLPEATQRERKRLRRQGELDMEQRDQEW
jgi:hypothetical protein